MLNPFQKLLGCNKYGLIAFLLWAKYPEYVVYHCNLSVANDSIRRRPKPANSSPPKSCWGGKFGYLPTDGDILGYLPTDSDI